MLYPEFMEYRRRRLEAAAPIGGRGSGRKMYYSHRQQPRFDLGASWSRGRPPPPPQRAGSGPGGCNGRHPGGRRCKEYRLYQPGGRNRRGGDYYEGYSAADLNPYQPRHYSEQYEDSSQQQQQQQQQQQKQQQKQQRQPQQKQAAATATATAAAVEKQKQQKMPKARANIYVCTPYTAVRDFSVSFLKTIKLLYLVPGT